MVYTVVLLTAGIFLVAASGYSRFWHSSLEHPISTVIRVASLLVGLLCLCISARVLA
jgi:hypothetical protein